jgi:DNA processing protein
MSMIYTEEQKHWIWLASLPGIGAKTFYRLLKAYGSAADFYDAVAAGRIEADKIPPDVMAAAKAACSKARAAEILAELESKSIHVITRLDDIYPAQLAAIPWPPPVLFVRGKLPALDDAIGIVGTRGCTRRGFEHTRTVAAELHMPVVSGMARGIDTAAHLGALDGASPTVAVLGCGVDVVYPPENDALYHRIVETGAVVSELPPGAGPVAANFPVRNRIIAGLCRGLLVAESGLAGGTAITASLAIGYGRDIFVMPGSPYIASSALPNELLTKGAVAVRSAADIRSFYGEKTLDASRAEVDLPPMDFFQQRIYELLRREDMSVEDIAAAMQGAPGEVGAALTMMELSGLCRRLPGGKYGA